MAKDVNAKTWALEPDANGDRWSAGQAEANLPPVWSGAPASLNVAAGSLVNFYQWCSDPNSDQLTYSLRQTPAGYSITSAGVLTVGPGNGTVVVRATDPGGLFSETSCTVSVTVTETVKWNPGHYGETQTRGAIPATNVTGPYGISGMANVKGIIQRYNWSTIETSRGVYDWTAIDADLAQLRPYGKRLIPLFMDRTWSGSDTSHLPTYLLTEIDSTQTHNITFKPDNTGVMSNLWLAPIMDRYIAMYLAALARYDSEPLLEMFQMEEITPSGASTNGYLYSNSSMITQWRRSYLALNGASKHTICASACNTLGGVSGPLNLEEYAYQTTPMIAMGGPDLIPPGAPDYQLPGDRVWMQNPSTAKGDNPALFLRDYRGKLACRQGVQTPSLGGKEGTFTPEQLASYACTTLRISHFSWVMATTTTINWPNHIFPYLQGSPLSANTTFPTQLAAAAKSPNTGDT